MDNEQPIYVELRVNGILSIFQINYDEYILYIMANNEEQRQDWMECIQDGMLMFYHFVLKKINYELHF
jgi:hypothetical protein